MKLLTQGCFGLNSPTEDLIITDNHLIRIPNSKNEIAVERLANGYNIIRTECLIPKTYSVITEERIFIPINNVAVCTWAEERFNNYINKYKLSYNLL